MGFHSSDESALEQVVLHDSRQMAVVRGEAEIGLASRSWATRVGLGLLPLGRKATAYS